MDGLQAASSAISQSLAQGRAQLLVINKFGKVEAEGGGLRGVIGEAVERGIPVLIAVPSRNLPEWRAFAGEFAAEFNRNDPGLAEWLAAWALSEPALVAG
jgi:hypothetical protein